MALAGSPTNSFIRSGWIRAVLLFLANVIAGLGIGMALQSSVKSGTDTQADFTNTWLLASSVTSIILVTVFRTYVDRKSIRSLGTSPSLFFPAGLVGFLSATFLVCAGSMVIFLSGALEWTDINMSNQILPALPLLLLIAVAEEMVFRGYILRNLMKSFHRWAALAGSALLFTLVHLTNPGIPLLGAVNIALGGLVLGITYMTTRSLWAPVLFHFSWNVLQGPVLGMAVSGLSFNTLLSASLTGSELLTGGKFGFEGSLVCTALLLITFLFLFSHNLSFQRTKVDTSART